MEKVLFFKSSIKRLMHEAKKKGIPIPGGIEIFLFIAGIFCSRATLLSVMRPFGGAFFAAVFKGRFSYIYMLSAISGAFFSHSPLFEAGKYIFAMTMFAVITDHLPQKSKSSAWIRGCVFSFSLLLSGVCFIFASQNNMSFVTIYDVMLLILECCTAFGACCGFYIAMPAIQNMKISYSFSTREEISLIAFFGCALWGAKDIVTFGIFNLSDIICILIILIFSIRLGSGRGVIAGLCMGLVSSLGSGRVDISCVSFAFSALCASLVGSFGAIPACSAFILSNALITILANGSTETLISIYDIFAACALYALIPERVLLRITSFGARDEKDRLVEDERFFASYIMQNASEALDALSLRIARIEEKRHVKNEAEVRFFERIVRKGCTGCGMRRMCTLREGQKTLSVFLAALADYMDSGKLKGELLPPNCLRPKEIRDAFLASAEIYRIEIMWQGKLLEMREAAKGQMSAFSAIINASERALAQNKSFDRALSDDITRRLNDCGIKCNSVIVMRDDSFDPTVILDFNSPCDVLMWEKEARDIVSSSCGTQMVRAGKRDGKTYRVKYVVRTSSSLNFAISGKSRDKKAPSGDSVRYRLIDKGIYAAVLCDGMGFGEKAAFEARGAAETLLDLIEAGLDGNEAMNVVNSLLIPYGEATFSAADLCIYNANEQTARIIKCGGAASFTKSNGRVDALYSKSMPLGSVVKSSIEAYTLSAKSGDIIVMISDGVLESGKDTLLKDAWLIGELEDFSGNDPKSLSDTIVTRALERCHSEQCDDITVFTAFIE